MCFVVRDVERGVVLSAWWTLDSGSGFPIRKRNKDKTGIYTNIIKLTVNLFATYIICMLINLCT